MCFKEIVSKKWLRCGRFLTRVNARQRVSTLPLMQLMNNLKFPFTLHGLIISLDGTWKLSNQLKMVLQIIKLERNMWGGEYWDAPSELSLAKSNSLPSGMAHYKPNLGIGIFKWASDFSNMVVWKRHDQPCVLGHLVWCKRWRKRLRNYWGLID